MRALLGLDEALQLGHLELIVLALEVQNAKGERSGLKLNRDLLRWVSLDVLEVEEHLDPLRARLVVGVFGEGDELVV